MFLLSPKPLTAKAFTPFGDVIETRNRDYFMINEGSTRRYHKLGAVQLGQTDDQAIISIFHAQALSMPLNVKMMERHPQGSQAFIPLKGHPFLIIVAPTGDGPNPEQMQAFITDGTQGINYHTGVWHHPIICCAEEDDFLIVDRDGEGNNCDEHFFTTETKIVLDPSA